MWTQFHPTGQPKGLEPGIYFGLPAEDYHADPALSYSGMKNLLESHRMYWDNSPLNPETKLVAESEAKADGQAFHMLLLEGREEFFKHYAIVPGMALKPGIQAIGRSNYERIAGAIEALKEVPTIAKMFTVGVSEVSMIWKDERTGVMLRARHDYLLPFGSIDFKFSRDTKAYTIRMDIAKFGYVIQSGNYTESIIALRKAVNSGKAGVYGDVDKKFLKAFLRNENCIFNLIFQRNAPPHCFELVEFEPEVINEGYVHVNAAVDKYLDAIKTYGISRWPAGSGNAMRLSVFQLPKSHFL